MRYIETKESTALMPTCPCGWPCSPLALEITHPQEAPHSLRVLFPCPKCNRPLAVNMVLESHPHAADPPKTPPSATDVSYADLAKHAREVPK